MICDLISALHFTIWCKYDLFHSVLPAAVKDSGKSRCEAAECGFILNKQDWDTNLEVSVFVTSWNVEFHWTNQLGDHKVVNGFVLLPEKSKL